MREACTKETDDLALAFLLTPVDEAKITLSRHDTSTLLAD